MHQTVHDPFSVVLSGVHWPILDFILSRPSSLLQTSAPILFIWIGILKEGRSDEIEFKLNWLCYHLVVWQNVNSVAGVSGERRRRRPLVILLWWPWNGKRLFNVVFRMTFSEQSRIIIRPVHAFTLWSHAAETPRQQGRQERASVCSAALCVI